MGDHGRERASGGADTVTASGLDATAAPEGGGEATLGRGACIGRYIVLDRIGQGGMGVVYAAYDPELDRKLAVKLLRPSAAGPDQTDRRARLLREAQALARLAHPNVVAVHDVGTLGDQVFLAMEFVAGGTLRAWRDAAPRTWREMLEAYRQAGRALAAAHALGIVHRDFKPDNALIDADGRVRVVDFGLARAAGDVEAAARGSAAPDWEQAEGGAPRPALAATLTHTGALLGTPGYIAPEQYQGQAQASADQFSFCVSLWEALYGDKPFAGETLVEIGEAMARGAVREPPRGASVPAWVQRTLLRGLRARPEERFASMDELLAALARDPARARRRWIAGGALAVAALAGVVALPRLRTRAALCRGGDRKLVGVWDGARRHAVEAAFAATRLPYAGASFRSLAGALDAWAAAWSAMRADACEATRVRGEQSEALLDLRMACLDDRLREVGALGEALARADAKTVEKAAQAAQSLPPLEDCANAAALKAGARLPDDAAARARIAPLRAGLAEARALESAGRFKEALARARPLAAEATALRFRPLEAQALLLYGSVQHDLDDAAGAAASLEAAVRAAVAGHDDASAARASTLLCRAVGMSHHEEGEAWFARAEAFIEALGGDDRLRAQLLNNGGVLRFFEARYDEALARYRESLALRRRVFGADSALVAGSLDNIGLVYGAKGDAQTAAEYHRRALAIEEKALGADHPTVSLTLTNLAVALGDQGRYDEALAIEQRALRIKEARWGADSMMYGVSLNELGNIYYYQGRYAEAAAVFRRIRAIYENTLGPAHPRLASALNNLGNVLTRLGRLDEAERTANAALAMKLSLLGPDHADVAHSYVGLGDIALERGRAAEGLRDYERALAIWRKHELPDSPLLAAALTGIGQARLVERQPAQAKQALEQALAIRERRPGNAFDLADTRLFLAAALRRLGEGERARALVAAADRAFAAAGARGAAHRRETGAWLARHGVALR